MPALDRIAEVGEYSNAWGAANCRNCRNAKEYGNAIGFIGYIRSDNKVNFQEVLNCSFKFLNNA